jgi:hypothetical protein
LPDKALAPAAKVVPTKYNAPAKPTAPTMVGAAQSKMIAIWSLYQQMVVIRHQTIRMANPVIPMANLLQYQQKLSSIIIIVKDISTLIPSGSNVVKRPWKFQS